MNGQLITIMSKLKMTKFQIDLRTKPKGFKVGAKYRLANPNDKRKYHVIHNDEVEKIVVVKYYGIHKRLWHYEIWDYLQINIFNQDRKYYRRVK